MAVTGQGWPYVEGNVPLGGIERLLIRMRGLRAIGTVLHIGAHPDDEDAGLIVMMARKYAARVVYWSATRGEAGQNRIGSYSGSALGIYRTWESLAARSIDGGESLFGPFYDFGYCTTAEEAFAKWGRRELLREIVRAIRLVQPQVLVGRFSGHAVDGHGQHRAVGAATTEAFEAAADPEAFVELGLPAWQTQKFYQSTGGDWQAGEVHSLGEPQPAFERAGFLRIDTGERDPVAGVSYQQLAWAAFNSHRSQAMGFVPERGSFYYYYKLAKCRVATPPHEQSMYDGLDTSLLGLLSCPGAPADAGAALAAVVTDVDAALCRVRPDDTSAAVAPLVAGLATLRRVRAELDPTEALARTLDSKIASFQEVIVGCLGVDADCTVARAHVRAGERVQIRAQFWNSAGAALDGISFRLTVPDGWIVTTDWSAGTPLQVQYDVVVADDAPVTTPSWLREPHDSRQYGVVVDTFACQPLDPPLVILESEFLVAGERVTFRRPALRREPFPGGYRELPLSVLPAISVTPQTGRIFLPFEPDPHHFDVHAAIEREVVQTDVLRLHLTSPADWTVTPAAIEIPVEQRGDVALARFHVTVPGATTPGRYRLTFAIGTEDGQPAVTFEPVWMGASGLPRLPDASTCTREAFLVTPASVDVHVVDATFARWLKYGYVEGAAEALLPALHRFGLKTSVITDEEMSFLDLAEFDAIVIGPNAYLLRDELRRNADRFLDYVAAGGTLIVQYQAYGYEQHPFAPYRFAYNHPHDRVTSADAPITILEPRHVLMTHPNRISSSDFDGWTHDRGLYFFGDLSDRYTPILECSDPGDAPKRGGLVVATHGRGAFVYVGYSLFRQIPAGVPGAFRLLANLLALPEALLLERVERLRKLSLFSFMNDAQLMAVARIVSEVQKTAGTYLCRRGEVGQELFIVIKGEVEIITQSDGKPLHLTAREGEVVGEFAILADIPRTADLQARTNLHLLAISSVHFRALIREHAEIAEQVIRQLVMKIVGG